MTYGTMIQADIGFVGLAPPGGANWTQVPFTGEIKDGAEIYALTCDKSAPDMKFDRHIIDVVTAIKHGKRDESGPDWTDRTDIVALYNEISHEVRKIVYDIDKVVK